MSGYNAQTGEWEPEERPDLLAKLRNAEWLDAQDLPPLRWVVPGVIPEGLSVFVGPPKVGKSWLVLDVALAAAAGGYALGSIRTTSRPVLLLALEDGDRRLQDRMRALHRGPLPRRLDYLTDILPSLVDATIRAWVEHVGTQDAPLVILDTLGKVMPIALPGESAYQRDYRAAGALKRITDDHPGMALVIVHHDRKAASDDFVESVSGTHGIAGAADSVLVLGRPRNQSDGLLKVTGRDVTEREYAVTQEGGAWRLAGRTLDEAARTAETTRNAAGVGDRMGELLRFAAEHPDGIRAGDAEAELGMSTSDARVYLKRAVDAGRLLKLARGLYAPPPVPPVMCVTGVTAERDNVTEVTPSLLGEIRVCLVCGEPLSFDEGTGTHPTCSPEAGESWS